MDSKYLNEKLAKYSKLQETLEKDVGRIVFPELNPKNTRPDQNVKTIDPSKSYKLGDKTFSVADVEAKKVAQKLPDYEDVRTRAEAGAKGQFSRLKGKEMSEGTVLSHPIDGSNLSAVKTPEVANKYAPSTAEHEGLHSLINDTASLYGIPKEDIYDKMNSMTDSSYHPYISRYLESSGYSKDNIRHELVTHMRDLLVSPQKRERVFEGVPEDKKRAAMNAIRSDFNKIRKWAKNITPEKFYDDDLEKNQPQIIFNKLDSKNTRPEQDVKRIKSNNAASERVAIKQTGNRDAVNAMREDPNIGFFSKNSKNSYVSDSADYDTLTHEAAHKNTSRLIDKYGEDRVSVLYSKIKGLIPHNLYNHIKDALLAHPEYQKTYNSPKARDKIGFAEEVVNTLRGLAAGGESRDAFRNHFEQGGKLGRYKDFNQFDNHVKITWKNIVEFAKDATEDHMR